MGILSAHFVVASWVKIAFQNNPAKMAGARKGQHARRYTKSIEFVSLRARKKKASRQQSCEGEGGLEGIVSNRERQKIRIVGSERHWCAFITSLCNR
jgi:hypothetical protein